MYAYVSSSVVHCNEISAVELPTLAEPAILARKKSYDVAAFELKVMEYAETHSNRDRETIPTGGEMSERQDETEAEILLLKLIITAIHYHTYT